MDDGTAMNESTRPGERYCRRCGYNLHGLDKHRCPECGQGFDPADRRTFRTSPHRAWHKWARRGGVLVLAVVLLLAGGYGWLYWGWKQEQQALAKLPGFRVRDTKTLGPPWLAERSGPAGFVLERVRSLNGSNTSATDLTPLAGLTELQWLFLGGTPVTDLTPLSKLTGLQTLVLGGTPVTDLRPLAKLSGLQMLGLDRTPVTDLTPLARLNGLQRLSLARTSVTDLTPLATLTGLQYLRLTDTAAKDLTPLAGLTALQVLYLNRTPVTDLTPLSKLTGLQVLGLSGTPVTDLTPLAQLTGLQVLPLPAGIPAEDVAKLQRALPQCRITQPDAPIPATQPADSP